MNHGWYVCVEHTADVSFIKIYDWLKMQERE